MAMKPKNTWALVAAIVFALLLSVAVVALDVIATPISGVLRVAALIGYQGVFLASLSSLYLVELTKYFGRRFVKVHHVVSVTALITLFLHGGLVAWQFGGLGVFLPTFRSLRSFLQFGGAPALWLISVASLAALFRASLRKQWRQIHWLNYLAFLLGTIHAQLLGTNFQHLLVRIVSGAMAAALVGVFVTKRVRKRRRQRR